MLSSIIDGCADFLIGEVNVGHCLNSITDKTFYFLSFVVLVSKRYTNMQCFAHFCERYKILHIYTAFCHYVYQQGQNTTYLGCVLSFCLQCTKHYIFIQRFVTTCNDETLHIYVVFCRLKRAIVRSTLFPKSVISYMWVMVFMQ